MHSRIEILRAAPNHTVFFAKNTLLVFPKHMTATHHTAVLGYAHFLIHKRFGAFIHLLYNGVVLLKPFRRYFSAFGEQNKTDNDSKCQLVYKSLIIYYNNRG